MPRNAKSCMRPFTELPEESPCIATQPPIFYIDSIIDLDQPSTRLLHSVHCSATAEKYTRFIRSQKKLKVGVRRHELMVVAVSPRNSCRAGSSARGVADAALR